MRAPRNTENGNWLVQLNYTVLSVDWCNQIKLNYTVRKDYMIDTCIHDKTNNERKTEKFQSRNSRASK